MDICNKKKNETFKESREVQRIHFGFGFGLNLLLVAFELKTTVCVCVCGRV